MRYLIIVKATAASEARVMPSSALLEDMGRYHQELAAAGVLLDGAGLRPSADGWRIEYETDGRDVVPGPFPETKSLISGYTLIEVSSPEEALEWSRRYPNPAGEGVRAHIEVRRLFEEEDFSNPAS